MKNKIFLALAITATIFSLGGCANANTQIPNTEEISQVFEEEVPITVIEDTEEEEVEISNTRTEVAELVEGTSTEVEENVSSSNPKETTSSNKEETTSKKDEKKEEKKDSTSNTSSNKKDDTIYVYVPVDEIPSSSGETTTPSTTPSTTECSHNWKAETTEVKVIDTPASDTQEKIGEEYYCIKCGSGLPSELQTNPVTGQESYNISDEACLHLDNCNSRYALRNIYQTIHTDEVSHMETQVVSYTCTKCGKNIHPSEYEVRYKK